MFRDSRRDTQLNVLSTRRGFREVRLPKKSTGVKPRFPAVEGQNGHFALGAAPPLLSQAATAAAAAAARLRRKIVSGQFDEENPFVLISSVLLVQADEGVSFMVVDRIGDIYRNLSRRADVIVTTVGARHKCQQVHTSEGIEILVVDQIGHSSTVQPSKGHFPRVLVVARRLVARVGESAQA
ncbi:hypothetical protein F511_40856 [Dorcoceras hygrometricum]|uniref:Uncharacterized protein n=1 Tax=Dorcoceras hygrometricum TaxID=472368 RepID=A0A2Z7D2M9_9LAMI|nr:hypothetical protein F511_40856 [Dorcoceras hygrometricum]